MCGVDNGLGDFALQARQADVKPCSEEVNVARMHRSISASMATSAGSVTFILLATSPIALMKQADQPAANNCSGFVPVPGTTGSRELNI